jgi:SAM-dependent methyltransferase
MKPIPTRLQKFRHIKAHNWLIHELMISFLSEAAHHYASGALIDIGCGQKPYQSVFAPYVSQHTGVDLADSPHGTLKVDIIGNAYDTNLEDAICDTVLCTEVLEHLEEPQVAVKEMNRILKPGGFVILTVPFFWPIHEAPRDFYRYSEHGLRYLFEQSGFEIVEIRPLSGYIVTFAQMSIYFLRRFQRGLLLRSMGRFFNWVVQHLALKLNRYDKSTDFTNLYGLVAQKIEDVSSKK